MKIVNNNNINFGAKFITTAQIQHIIDNKSISERVNFVEIKRNNNFDRLLVHDLKNTWHQKLSDDFYSIFFTYPFRPREKFYALTTQKENLEKLDTSSVLGILSLSKRSKRNYYVDILQTNPKYIKNKKINIFQKITAKIYHFFDRVASNDSEYSHTGKSILDIIKNKFNANRIELISSKEAIDFYRKQGFHQLSNSKNSNMLEWIKK